MSSHEQYSRDYAVEGAANRRFGLIVGGIFGVIGCIRAYLHGEFGWLADAFVVIGGLLMAAARVAPDALTPVNRGWNRLGLLLHKITNPFFLGLMYVPAIVPTGLAMRAFGKDPMARKTGSRARLWVKRTSQRSSVDTLIQPF